MLRITGMTNLQLNLTAIDPPSLVERKYKEVAKKSKQRKSKAVPLSMDEAWKKIGAMKNSDSDRRKLREVYEAMANGRIEREVHDKTFTKAEAMRLYTKLAESTRQEKLQLMVDSAPSNFLLVTKLTHFNHMLRNVEKASLIGLDTETTGINPYSDTIVGLSISIKEVGLHWYVPIAHDEHKADQDVLHSLTSMLAQYNREIVFHNATFDLHILRENGYPLNGGAIVHDTMVMMHLLNENEPSYRLKDLATKYLKAPSDNFDELFGKDCKFNTVPLDLALAYACKDTKLTLELFLFCKKYLKEVGVWQYYIDVEQPLIRVVERMEAEGFVVDLEQVETTSKETEARINELATQIQTTLGEVEEINLNSPLQLKQALLNIGIKVGGTSAKELKKRSDKPVVEALLEYKKLIKFKTGFVDKIPELIQSNGKIHGSFNSMGTVTGRFSARNPNYQQQPQSARKLYKVDDESLIISMDFSGQEVRLLAHLTDDPFLKSIYANKQDFYTNVASKIFDKPVEECGDGSKYRKQAKVVVLALLYGMANKTLAESLGISKSDADKIVEDFFNNFTKVRSFMDDNLEHARANGYVEMVYGRKRRLPQINSRDWYEKSRAERMAQANAIIQGSSAIQTKITMIALDKYCRDKQREGRNFGLLATIHDELLIRVPKDVIKQEVKELEYIMCNSFPMSVETVTDIAISNGSWGDMVSVEEVFPDY